MRKLGGILAIAVLALSACSAPQTGPHTVPAQTIPASTTADIEPATIDLSGATAAAPAPETDDLDDRSRDALYLRIVKEDWVGELPSDDELVAAGLEGCRQLLDGVVIWDVKAVTGGTELADQNNGIVLANARPVYCPSV